MKSTFKQRKSETWGFINDIPLYLISIRFMLKHFHAMEEDEKKRSLDVLKWAKKLIDEHGHLLANNHEEEQ